jgi:aminocarboxymuconate-semialdehyde decarboxylase
MAIDRRRFLRTTAAAGGGWLFCHCGLTGARTLAAAQAPAGRRPVTIGGRRIRTIDMHSHVYVGDVWPLVQGRPGVDPNLDGLAMSPMALDRATLDRRLQEMDRQGIDVHVVSVHPGQYFYWADQDLSARIVRIQNEKIAEVCAAQPDRFVGLGAVSLHQPSLVVEQMDHAVSTLGLRGFIVGASVNGEDLVAPTFEPFWKKAEALGVVVFVHPGLFPAVGTRFNGAGALGNTIGFPLDTTIALSHMIFEGFLDRYPGVRIVAAHGGGFLPSYIGRSDNCHGQMAPCQGIKRKPSEYLRGPQLHFDSLVYNSQNVRHLVNEAGASQIVVGTDFAFDVASYAPVETVLATPGLSPDEQIAILSGNAERLLRI